MMGNTDQDLVKGSCALCQQTFEFDPATVLSMRVVADDPFRLGEPGVGLVDHAPLCPVCVARVDRRRERNGAGPAWSAYRVA